jgi:hypothetical protein
LLDLKPRDSEPAGGLCVGGSSTVERGERNMGCVSVVRLVAAFRLRASEFLARARAESEPLSHDTNK